MVHIGKRLRDADEKHPGLRERLRMAQHDEIHTKPVDRCPDCKVTCPSVARSGKHDMAAINGIFEPWMCLSCGEYVERRDWRPGEAG